MQTCRIRSGVMKKKREKETYYNLCVGREIKKKVFGDRERARRRLRCTKAISTCLSSPRVYLAVCVCVSANDTDKGPLQGPHKNSKAVSLCGREKYIYISIRGWSVDRVHARVA